jgi:hypothetical protein
MFLVHARQYFWIYSSSENVNTLENNNFFPRYNMIQQVKRKAKGKILKRKGHRMGNPWSRL